MKMIDIEHPELECGTVRKTLNWLKEAHFGFVGTSDTEYECEQFDLIIKILDKEN